MSGVIKFTEDMKDMGSLVSLNLANNNLGAKGAKHVAEVLPKKSLVSLNLAENMLRAEGARTLAAVLPNW